MLAFHEYLKKCRINKGLSINEVAHATDISRSLIYEYETNKTFPNGKNLIKLARLYQFSLDDYFEIFPKSSVKPPIYDILGQPSETNFLIADENMAYYVLNEHQAVLVKYTNRYQVGKEILVFFHHQATIFKILQQKNQFFLLSQNGDLIEFQSKEIKIIGMILQWISF